MRHISSRGESALDAQGRVARLWAVVARTSPLGAGVSALVNKGRLLRIFDGGLQTAGKPIGGPGYCSVITPQAMRAPELPVGWVV